MSFDKAIVTTIGRKEGKALVRRSVIDLIIEAFRLDYTSKGLRMLTVAIRNPLGGKQRIGKWERKDWGKEGVPVDEVRIDFPFTLPKGCSLAVELYNPTEHPIGVRWGIQVKKPLWAVAIERIISGDNSKWEASVEYCHAFTPEEATTTVLASEVDRSKVRIVATAKPVGYHVEDNQGRRLRA